MKRGKIGFASDVLKTLSKGAGYDSNSAIAELVDNSMGAGADVIKITARNGRFKIEDYGENAGMDEKTLIRNFFYGGNSSTKSKDGAPGKFGVGGKTGILSIIGDMNVDVEITTHRNGCKPIAATWEVRRGSSNAYTYDVLEDDSIPCETVIEFDHDKDINICNFIDFASVVYCWAINSGKRLYINDVLVTPNDPLYRNNKNVIERGLFSSKSFKVLNESIIVNATQFDSGSAIPEEELHSWDKGNGKTKSVSTANRSGIYVITDGRYYTLGNNFDKIMGGTAHASLDGLRIEVVIPKSLWDLIGITWNKGKEITPFTQIECFNTGDKDTGVCDYILSLMADFRSADEDKKAAKVAKSAEEAVNSYGVKTIKVVVVSDTNNSNHFIEYSDGTLKFNTSRTSIGKQEVKGIVRALSVAVDSLSKTDNYEVINEIVEKLNS